MGNCNISNLYCTKKIDFTKEPLFFGSGKNTQRFDILKYKFFDDNNETQLGFFWRPDEIKLTKDAVHLKKLKDNEKWILTKVLQKLIFLDSLQGRGPMLTFAQITTLPEVENCILTWDFFEGSIHSRSYSHILQDVYPEPDKIFDQTFEIDILMEHAKNISKYYNELYDLVIQYQFYKSQGELTESLQSNIEFQLKNRLKDIEVDSDMKDKIVSIYIDTLRDVLSSYNIDDDKEFMKKIKKSIVLALANVNILEGIRFYSGFASVWALTEGQGYIPGISNILKLICRDENVHLALTQNFLKILARNEDEGFSEIFKEVESEIYDMYKEAVEQEFEWADYLYSKGGIIGMNAQITKDYLKYICNRRLKAIGLKHIFPSHTKNPIPWINSWIEEAEIEDTPQETEITDYVQGGIDMGDDIDDLSEYSDIFK